MQPERSKTLVPGRVPAMHRRRQVRREVERRVHEGEVRERLGEVPEHALGPGVVLLREEPEVVAQVDEAPEQLVRLLVPAEQLVAVAEPERAGKEHALAGRQAVDCVLVCPIAEYESFMEQLPLDRLDRAADARVGGGEEPYERQQQEAGIELLRPVRLRERAELGVEATLADVPVDLAPGLTPVVDRPLEPVLFDRPY